jgi:signal transduction histidine kinase
MTSAAPRAETALPTRAQDTHRGTSPPSDVGSGDELHSLIASYNDVTERLKRSHEMLVREVVRLRRQLEAKDRELARRERLAALGEMAAGVAHEIRNPLAAIALYASVLERDLDGQTSALKVLSRIREGVCRVEHIVSDTLAFSRGSEPRIERVSLEHVVRRAVLQCSHAPEAAHSCGGDGPVRGAVVEIDSSVRGTPLECDAGQIEQALANVIANAMEASGSGGHVRVWCPPTDRHHVELRVDDDGPGVREEHAGRVFDPFFTTKEQGTGLGLTIVHRIVESHGGRAWLANRVEGGASFHLVLPAGGRRGTC